MKKITLVSVLAFCCLAVPALAQDNCVDPLNRNLIFVEGTASLTVSADEFEIRFGFDIEKDTFQNASAASERIIADIEKGVNGLGLSDVEVIRGWGVLKQAKISFTSRERKISNRIIIRVHAFPEGRLQDLIARIIDNSLKVDSAIVLEDIRVSLSETTEQVKKKEVLETALKHLKVNAEGAAAMLGESAVTPKRIYVTHQPVSGPRPESMRAAYDVDLTSWKDAASVSYNKGFEINTEISDRITLTASVAGMFQIGGK